MSEDPVFNGKPARQNLTNPQTLNSYNYANGNPVNAIDPTGEGPRDIAVGMLNAFFSNNAFGVGRISANQYNGNRADYLRGQALGDRLSIVLGVAESLFGKTVSAGGAALTITSAGTTAPVSVPLLVAGAAVGAHGTSAAALGTVNLLKSQTENGDWPKSVGPKPPKKFIAPTNEPQMPPEDLPDGVSIRISPPNAVYPNGSWRLRNEFGNYLDPSTMTYPDDVSSAELQSMTHTEFPEGGYQEWLTNH